MTKNVDNSGNKDSNGNERLNDLSVTLMGVENDLIYRALNRSREELEKTYGFINKAAEDGVIDIDCDDCDDNDEVKPDEVKHDGDEDDKDST